MKDGDTVVHLAKVGADFCKVQQTKESDFDDTTAFQTIKLSLSDKTLFSNKAPGGSELLRLISKSNHKDTQARLIEQMEFLDNACKERPQQEVEVEGVGKVAVQHRLVNCLHDGKERLAIVQHKVRKSENTVKDQNTYLNLQVAKYYQEGVVKKPAGYGDPAKVSTQTCQVCLQDPKSYNQESSLAAAPVMFADIKHYSCSPMHLWMRIFEATWNAAVDSQVNQVECTRPDQPCTLHPTLFVVQKA